MLLRFIPHSIFWSRLVVTQWLEYVPRITITVIIIIIIIIVVVVVVIISFFFVTFVHIPFFAHELMRILFYRYGT